MQGKTLKKGVSLGLAEVSLPEDYPWKVLTALVNDLSCYLVESERDLLTQIIRDRDVASLEILQDTWNLQQFSIGSEKSETHVSILRAKLQISALLKKYRFNSDKDMRQAKALEKFKLAEAACQEFNQSGYLSLSFGETEHDAKVLTYARCFLKKLLGERCLSKDLLTRWSRHGPGSNLDTCKSQTSIYFKYDNWPYSCTRDALRYARFLIATDKRWLGALENSYRERYNIPKHFILNREVFWSKVFTVVDENRIAFVPKDARTERTIAIEPTMNLMLQLGVDGFIRSRLKRWNVNLDSQEKNQVLAYRGSVIQGSEEFVTLDLAMASDSVSLKLCEILLPPDWYTYLCHLRAPFGLLGKERISYEKISSMGNGYTFALESALFTSLIYGVIRAQSGACDFSTFAVYGDDIIVQRKYVDRVIRALKRAGFSLNLDKSFLKGPVKESCGTDWIHGRPVRPVFLQDIPKDVMSLFVDINRLKRLLSLRWSIEDSYTVKYMTRWIPNKFRHLSGPYSNTQFESYLHTNLPKLGYENGGWKYKFLIRKPVEVPGAKDFFFRKLMHNLREFERTPVYEFKDWKRRASSGGSRFAVYKSYSYTVSESYTHTDFWCGSYAE